MAKRQIFNYTFTPGVNQAFNAFPNAFARLVANKNYIAEMALAFIANQVANNVAPFINFVFDRAKIKRDINYLIDAVVNDLRYNGNGETVLISSFFWKDGAPQITGDRLPEIAVQNYIRDLINNNIFTGTAASPAYQTVVTQITTGANAEAGASTRITSLYSGITSTISTGISPAIVASNGSLGTIEIDGNFELRDLLIINNNTRNVILYSLADATKTVRYIFNNTTNRTKYIIAADTTAMVETDTVQVFVEGDAAYVKPHPTYQDPVEKMRVSTPQSLMDTDFEYSLQGTKWETVSLINNIPSVFSKANEPSFTASQITSMLPIPGGGYATSVTNTTYAPNGRTNLTLLFGSNSYEDFGGGGYAADDFNLQVALPFNISFLGQTYSSVYVGSNGYVTFGGGASQFSGFSGNSPPLPRLSIAPGDRGLWAIHGGQVGNKYIIRVIGTNYGDSSSLTNHVEYHFYPNSNIIDVHQIYVDVIESPSIADGINSNYVATFSIANGQARRIVTAPGSNRDVQITVNVTPTTPFAVGMPIVLKETANLFLDGAYLIKQVISPTVFRATTSRALVAGTNYRTNYSTIYTGGFFTSSEIPISNITAITGTTNATINFTSPHGLFPGQSIYIVDVNQNNAAHIGAFTILEVVSANSIRYSTNEVTPYASATTLSTATTRIYVRPQGVAQHRYVDGGVQINPGTSTPNTQIIRQTRKYFRYQSGKGMQFSTGVLFAPTYDIASVSVTTNVFSVSNPFYDLNITTDTEHGFAQPDAFRAGAYVQLSGFQVTSGPNYNGLYFVSGIVNEKQFTVKINPNITDLSPGGALQVRVLGWQDASVRDGMFDDQNGLFFEHDGTELAVVKRSSTFQVTGTITATANSSNITGLGTKFLTQLAVGDMISIKGCSYLVTTVASNTSMTVQPDYRGSTESAVRILKTIDTRVLQRNFNIDKLDGTGPSGYVFDKNKMQMVFIDYSWYGAGKIRYGMRGLDGSIIYCHEIVNNNVNTEAYMRSGNLPGRFEINTKSKLGKLTSTLSTSSSSFTMLTTDANQFPRVGRVFINNEIMRYTKGTISGVNTNFTINQRNEYGLSSNTSASIGNAVISFNQNCAPSLSHWGVSVMMDGRFDEDKSYLFTAASANNILIPVGQERPIVSMRLAPSVDNGIGREFGVRNLINRSALTLKNLGIAAAGVFQISVRINSETTVFTTTANWQPTGNGSISQYLDHSAGGLINPAPTGGDNVFSFFAEDSGSPGRFSITSEPVAIIRELGNSVLGGNNIYPDGPDILTVFARNMGSSSANIRARISWTEAQG
jgi:hypothetical protein